MTVVVLGWDGLDPDLLREFGVEGSFGAVREIETVVNRELGKPHTWELWPSIITGQHPDEHGIHAEEYIEDSWSNPLVRWAAKLSTPLPDWIRWRAGRIVRDAGATIDFETQEYYEVNGFSTVFDGRASYAVGVPNYRSLVDDAHGLVCDRGAALAEYMATETVDGETRRRPTVSPMRFMERIEADAAEKLALTRAAITQDYDLVFVWLAYVDTAGHVAPTVADPRGWMQHTYETTAQYTDFIKNTLTKDDTLLCVSDHGLQDGEHTETACISSWPHDHTDGVESVLDVAARIDELAPQSQSSRECFENSDGVAGEVRERLEDLGYV